MGYELVAAVDLGSNSFRLQVGRVVDDQIYPLDSLKEPVRLAAGLTAQKTLDGPSQLRALEALARFGERLRGFDAGAVRAVATNALRVAKNAPQFLAQAEAALGFPIEIIAGREEARLIYLGVAHTLPNPRAQQLVVDIGGGSTEFIIGRDIQPIELESLYMGCVGFSLKYFPRGRIEKSGMKAAELAARKELEAIVRQYRKTGWEEAVGSSGTAKALADILELNGLSGAGEPGITRDGLERLRGILLHAGDVGRLTLQGLRADRLPVLPGGLAIMLAVFREFNLERMTFSEGALRLGVLYDLLGRYHHQDLRNATVQQFMRRYQVDANQAARVAATARGFLLQMLPEAVAEEHPDAQVLGWAAALHEIGISVAHSSYHKHSAYILANADMPGFSRMDQARLSRIVLAHRGKLERVQSIMADSPDWPMIFSLRLAAILHRARDDAPLPAITARRSERGFVVGVDPAWLAGSPLSAAALDEETRQWSGLGMEIRIKSGRGKSQAAA
ncbi:MAG: exopolyphosphatase [Rhodocyclaceae bacterium]|jgi:exopolyphosphatase/guanosine-5'-triphosphate,3'-diphosphate pyrophosphatase|nr:exopolyphosphatase [Rhodocyclaceae bacterium]